MRGVMERHKSPKSWGYDPFVHDAMAGRADSLERVRDEIQDQYAGARVARRSALNIVFASAVLGGVIGYFNPQHAGIVAMISAGFGLYGGQKRGFATRKATVYGRLLPDMEHKAKTARQQEQAYADQYGVTIVDTPKLGSK